MWYIFNIHLNIILFSNDFTGDYFFFSFFFFFKYIILIPMIEITSNVIHSTFEMFYESVNKLIDVVCHGLKLLIESPLNEQFWHSYLAIGKIMCF